jgi:O-antigen/teichoic acid export membrane protein
MTLCVQVGLLGADIALISSYPAHRRAPASLLDTAIVMCALAAAVASLGFILLAAFGFHALHVLSSSPLYAGLFFVLTVLQVTWWVMDQAAVALRRSEHVVWRASLAASVTLTGVVIFGVLGQTTAAAILASWLAAATVACYIGLLQLRRATDGYRFRPRLVRQLARRMLSIGLPNFALDAADNAPGLILPIVTAELVSARAAAYWYAVWMMAVATYMIAGSFGLNMFAEASWSPAELARTVRHALRLGLYLAGAATVALVVLGPLVLLILGHAYADHATTPLRIVAFTAVPMMITKSYLYTCRAMRRTREATVVAAVVGVLAVGLAATGAATVGLTGIAVGWLGVQALAAIVCGLRLRSLLVPLERTSTAAAVAAGG